MILDQHSKKLRGGSDGKLDVFFLKWYEFSFICPCVFCVVSTLHEQRKGGSNSVDAPELRMVDTQVDTRKCYAASVP